MNDAHQTIVEDPDELKLYWALFKRDDRSLVAHNYYHITTDWLPRDVYVRDIWGLGPTKKPRGYQLGGDLGLDLTQPKPRRRP